MKFEVWYIAIGALLILVTLGRTRLESWPLTATVFYLVAGLLAGPLGFELARVDGLQQSSLIERLSEVAVVLSLFTAGLKLRLPLSDKLWGISFRLAFLSMTGTVGLITLAGVYWLGLPAGVAVLLGGVLAPTDPVLASEVQLSNATDKNRLRFSFTSEAGLNDGTAFPFVMLGLGLLGLHELGDLKWRWAAVDVIWAVAGGLGIGGLLGHFLGKVVLHLRREHKEGIGGDEFLALGLVALAYGAAVLLHAYGFLSVFASGLALRHIEHMHSGEKPPPEVQRLAAIGEVREVATDSETAPAYMAEAVLSSSEKAERFLEVALVMLVGIMFKAEYLTWMNFAFAAVLFLLIRPAAVIGGLLGSGVAFREQLMLSWFGIRGIGSVYYLMYALSHGVSPDLGERLIGITFTTIVLSIIVHGISATPLMRRYEDKWGKAFTPRLGRKHKV